MPLSEIACRGTLNPLLDRLQDAERRAAIAGAKLELLQRDSNAPPS
jgi:hypothetical protein